MLVAENFQQSIYDINIQGKEVSVFENYHMISLEDIIASYQNRLKLINLKKMI